MKNAVRIIITAMFAMVIPGTTYLCAHEITFNSSMVYSTSQPADGVDSISNWTGASFDADNIGDSANGCTNIKEKRVRGFSKALLGPVPDFVNMFLTPDKQHVVYVMQHGSNNIVFYDGKQFGPEFSGVLVDNSFVISSTGLRTAYAIGKEDPNNPCTTCGPQGKWHAVIDGEASPEYDKVLGLSFSPDGSHVAYAAITKKCDPKQPQSKDEWAIVVDGQETPIPYEALSYRSPAYTADGRLVYIAKKGDKAVVVVDGKEQQAYDRIGQPIPVFSADGKNIAYSALNGGSPEVVILNGKAGPGFEHIPPASLVFSCDGRLAYGARNADHKWSVAVDGKVGAQYNQVDNIVFSPDGKHLAYNAQRDNKWFLVVDDKKVVEGEQLTKGFAVFSPNSTRIAHGVRQNGNWKVIVVALDDSDKKTGHPVVTSFGEYDRQVSLITFSPDSRRIAFVTSNAWKQTVVVDGKSGLEFDAVTKPIFSPDSRRIAYEAARVSSAESQGKSWLVVVDGQPKPQFDRLIRSTVTFSADSKHVIYTVCQGDERLAIIDGRSSSPYKAIYSVLRHGERGFELLVSDSELYRVLYEPPM